MSQLVKFYVTLLRITLFAGMGILIFGAYYCYLSIRAQSWPVVHGNISKSHIDRSLIRGDQRYRAELEYMYSVNGFEYKGNRVSFINVATEGFSKNLMEQYPVGKAVNVYYNPKSPSESVLNPGFNLPIVLYLVIGGVFTVLSFVLLALKDKMVSSVIGLMKT